MCSGKPGNSFDSPYCDVPFVAALWGRTGTVYKAGVRYWLSLPCSTSLPHDFFYNWTFAPSGSLYPVHLPPPHSSPLTTTGLLLVFCICEHGCFWFSDSTCHWDHTVNCRSLTLLSRSIQVTNGNTPFFFMAESYFIMIVCVYEKIQRETKYIRYLSICIYRYTHVSIYTFSGSFTFKPLRNLHTIFHSSYTSVLSHQHSIKVLFPPHSHQHLLSFC